jgi:hypothetical protein
MNGGVKEQLRAAIGRAIVAWGWRQFDEHEARNLSLIMVGELLEGSYLIHGGVVRKIAGSPVPEDGIDENDCWIVYTLPESERVLSAPLLDKRQEQFVDIMSKDGGEWPPRRMGRLFGLADSRVVQIMKQLAELGIVEPVRPGARTYMLKENNDGH